MKITEGPLTAISGWPRCMKVKRAYNSRNRHLPEWRFLRFTMIVTVKAPICKVIRMSLTPFRVVWLTACRSCSAIGRVP